MTTFAEKLKAARKAAGLSQQGMADRMLIPKRTIENWEGGQRTPPPYLQRFVLNELESVDRRCKSCKWYEAKDPARIGLYDMPAWCSIHTETWPEDFCSYWTPKK